MTALTPVGHGQPPRPGDVVPRPPAANYQSAGRMEMSAADGGPCDCYGCERWRATTPPPDLVTLGHPSYHLPAMLEDIYRGQWPIPRAGIELEFAARLALGRGEEG
jgi:hypothetical protein